MTAEQLKKHLEKILEIAGDSEEVYSVLEELKTDYNEHLTAEGNEPIPQGFKTWGEAYDKLTQEHVSLRANYKARFFGNNEQIEKDFEQINKDENSQDNNNEPLTIDSLFTTKE